MSPAASPEVEISLDGRTIRAVAGESLVEAIERSGVEISHLCYHPSLGAIQSCDTCLVEVNGQLVRSCATRVAPGLAVRVGSATAVAGRQEGLRRVAENHHFRCTLCDNNNGDCALHNAARTLALDDQKFKPKPYAIDASSPFYQYDPSQCILCGRCVEACQDLVVNEVIHIDWSAPRPRVVWDSGVPVDQSSCVACGACVTVCPVDALLEKTFVGRGGLLTGLPEASRTALVDGASAVGGSFQALLSLSDAEAAMREAVVKKTKTVCTFCGVGCSFDVWTRQREVIKVKPRAESPANGLATCTKGKFGWGHVNSPDRLTRPLIREDGHFREASWEEAIALVARRLKEVRERWGPDATYVIASCTDTNEEVYLTQKFARAVLGTNNVDNCSRYCQSPATVGLWRTVGLGGDAGTIVDFGKAELVITMGSNTAESHPVIASRIKRAHKLDGHRLIVVDPRRHEMARRADLWLSPKPGTDLVLLNAAARYIFDHGWEAKEFLAQRVNGIDAFRASLAPYTLEYASATTGLTVEAIVRFATMVHEARSVVIAWAMGITQHQDGSETSTAISNLLLVTGNYGRPGTGGYPLRGHANVQGASDFGALPNYFTGYQKLDAPGVRERFEAAWGVPIPPKAGLTSVASVDAVLDGRIHAMYIVGEDKLLADAHLERTAEAFRKLDFLVVQEAFLTRTAQFADVVLPTAISLEKEGTFVNTERRIQRLYRAFPPLPGTKTDLDIVYDLAAAMGAHWPRRSPAELMEEIRSLAPMFAGVTYDRLEGYRSLLWPVAADGTDSAFLYAERFAFPDGKAVLYPSTFVPPIEPDAEYDLMVDNGRLLEHFHWRNLTSETAGLEARVPAMFVEVSPEVAREKALRDGDTVRLVSRTGSVTTRVWVSDRVSGRTVFLPLHGRAEDAVNLLTGPARDTVAGTPAYKETPARIEKIGASPEPEPPVPRSNFRRGEPAPPQLGVRVDQKWSRPDYRPIGRS
ncbi:MAG TPA: formate dehydrogenase subunit alpha [Thermoplasmata archaeon]|nr:formate dehydrogenase subunit alpha [Thermoplasmata archaeon]